MQTPLDFLNRFRVELRTSGIRFAITSGMACVHYGLQQTTKDSDWIVPPDQVDMLRGLFVRHEASPPPWTVRYRSIFGAPLESEWIAGGWTSHLSVRTEGGGPDHHVDFFGRPPRVRHWNADPSDPDFADRDTVTRMKKTDRDRDWPIVGGLAAQSFARNDSHAVLHLQAEDCPWPKSMPFAEQHALVVTAARRHDLPPTPLTPAARVAIYQAGLARAAVLANLEPNEIAKLAPPIEEMLP